MKFSLLSFMLCFIACSAIGQNDVIRRASCDDPAILKQADSLKREFVGMGFMVVREASMAMESEYEMAVMVPLTGGNLYHFAFIGDATSKLYEVRMYDTEENQVFYEKKMWGDVDGNIINFPYVPKVSEFYAIRPVQVNKKKKNLCGYVMLLKKVR
jgi:hypothetical protein